MSVASQLYDHFTFRPGLSQVNLLVSTANELASQYHAMADDASRQKTIREAAMLYSVAEGHLTEAQPAECLEAAKKALEMFREVGDDTGTVDTMNIIVNAHVLEAAIAMQKPEQAIKVAAEAKADFSKKGNKRGEAAMIVALADAEVRDSKGKKDLDKALKSVQNALKTFQDLADKRMEASSHLVLLSLFFMKNSSREAHIAADSAESLYVTLGDRSGQAKAFHGKGMAYAISEDFSNATKSAQTALKLYQELGDKRNEAFQLAVIAQWQLLQEKPANALKSANAAYQLAENLSGIRYAEAYALFLICESYIKKGQAKIAVQFAQDGLEAFEQRGDEFGIIAAFEILIHAHLADVPSNAVDSARRAAKRAETWRAEKPRLELSLMFTVCYAMTKNDLIEDAVETMQSAVQLAKSIGDASEEGDAWRMISHITSTRKNLQNNVDKIQEGISAAETAKALYQRSGNISGQASCIMLQCILKSRSPETSKHTDLIPVAKEAQSLYREAVDVAGEQHALGIIVELHVGAEEYDEALAVARSSVQLWKGLANKRGQIEAMHRVASVQILQQSIKSALEQIQEALELCKDIGANLLEANLLILMTQALVAEMSQQGVLDETGPLPQPYVEARAKAQKAVKDALLLAGKSGDRSLRAASLFWRSKVLVWGFKTADALKSAEEAHKLFQATKDARGESHALVLCADLYFILGQQKQAKDFANRALESAKDNPECAEAERAAQEVLGRMQTQDFTRVVEDVVSAELNVMEAVADKKVPSLTRDAVMPKVMELVKNIVASDDDDLEQDSVFMDAGVDSLSSVQLVGDLSREFKVPLQPAAIFDYPSVRSLVDHLIEESGS
mmetsp:Transcript_64081/g.99888  ORF Transcript_64081/g.99888 Transcript_64081/m.99888 type:complete len:850 (-) Transcript_64081:34-2583(-)